MIFNMISGPVEVQEFEIDDGILIKARISSPDDGGEGFWASIRPEDKERYDDDTDESSILFARMANNLFTLPLEVGDYVPLKCQGYLKPEVMCEDTVHHYTKLTKD